MQKESILKSIMVDAISEIFLKPEKDFPLGDSQTYRIIDGKYVRALFNNKKVECSSNDMLVGKRASDGVKQRCDTCDSIDACSVSCRLVLTNLHYGHVYYLNIPHMAQVSLSQYVEKLLLNNLDAPDVLTKITRVKNGKFTTYVFELASEWFTEEELNIITPITKAYTLTPDDERDEFDIETMLRLRGISIEKIQIIKSLLDNHG